MSEVSIGLNDFLGRARALLVDTDGPGARGGGGGPLGSLTDSSGQQFPKIRLATALQLADIVAKRVKALENAALKTHQLVDLVIDLGHFDKLAKLELQTPISMLQGLDNELGNVHDGLFFFPTTRGDLSEILDLGHGCLDELNQVFFTFRLAFGNALHFWHQMTEIFGHVLGIGQPGLPVVEVVFQEALRMNPGVKDLLGRDPVFLLRLLSVLVQVMKKTLFEQVKLGHGPLKRLGKNLTRAVELLETLENVLDEDGHALSHFGQHALLQTDKVVSVVQSLEQEDCVESSGS